MGDLKFNKKDEFYNIKIKKDSNLMLQEMLNYSDKNSYDFLEDLLKKEYRIYKKKIIDEFYENILKDNFENRVKNLFNKINTIEISNFDNYLMVSCPDINSFKQQRFNANCFYFGDYPNDKVSKRNLQELKDFIKDSEREFYDTEENIIAREDIDTLYNFIIEGEKLEERLKNMHIKRDLSFELGYDIEDFYLELKTKIGSNECYCNIDVIKETELDTKAFLNRISFLGCFCKDNLFKRYYFYESTPPKFLFICENEDTVRGLYSAVQKFAPNVLKNIFVCSEQDVLDGNKNFFKLSLVENSLEKVNIQFI